MKKIVLITFILTYSFLLACKAQVMVFDQDLSAINTTVDTINNRQVDDNKIIMGYKVIETVKQEFGDRKLIYKVSDKRLISNYDLSPNHTREIIPIFRIRQSRDTLTRKNSTRIISRTVAQKDQRYTTAKESETKKIRVPIIEIINQKESTVITSPIETNEERISIKSENIPKKKLQSTSNQKVAQNTTGIHDSKTSSKRTSKNQKINTNEYATIDIIKTYERLTDKGIESIEMLKKVGDLYFFDGELEKAQVCYTKLFLKTDELEPEYYYRYSISLKSSEQFKKADEFLKKYNQLMAK